MRHRQCRASFPLPRKRGARTSDGHPHSRPLRCPGSSAAPHPGPRARRRRRGAGLRLPPPGPAPRPASSVSRGPTGSRRPSGSPGRRAPRHVASEVRSIRTALSHAVSCLAHDAVSNLNIVYHAGMHVQTCMVKYYMRSHNTVYHVASQRIALNNALHQSLSPHSSPFYLPLIICLI